MKKIDTDYIPLPKSDLMQLRLLIDDLTNRLHQTKRVASLKDRSSQLLNIQGLVNHQEKLVKEVNSLCYRMDIAKKAWHAVVNLRSSIHE